MAALELRPNCELCNRDLPPAATNAFICSYECTFCADCVANALHNVCPNCGGGFAPRPIRTRGEWRKGEGLKFNPAGTTRRHTKYTREEIAAFVATVEAIPSAQR